MRDDTFVFSCTIPIFFTTTPIWKTLDNDSQSCVRVPQPLRQLFLSPHRNKKRITQSLAPHGLIHHTLSLTPRPSSRIVTEKITHDKFCKIMEKKKMKIWKKFSFLSLAKTFLDPAPLKSGIRIHIKTFWIRHTGLLSVYPGWESDFYVQLLSWWLPGYSWHTFWFLLVYFCTPLNK